MNTRSSFETSRTDLRTFLADAVIWAFVIGM
jgi:hypothetical protein